MYDRSPLGGRCGSADAKDLVSAMLTVDPSKRPTAGDLLRHPWITNTSAEEVGLM